MQPGFAYNSNGDGDRHLYYGYNFGAIPVGAVINGIEGSPGLVVEQYC